MKTPLSVPNEFFMLSAWLTFISPLPEDLPPALEFPKGLDSFIGNSGVLASDFLLGEVKSREEDDMNFWTSKPGAK